MKGGVGLHVTRHVGVGFLFWPTSAGSCRPYRGEDTTPSNDMKVDERPAEWTSVSRHESLVPSLIP
jgi:hypothetical protein